MPEDQLLKTYVDISVYRQFARLAEKEQRSLAAQLRIAVYRMLEREGKK